MEARTDKIIITFYFLVLLLFIKKEHVPLERKIMFGSFFFFLRPCEEIVNYIFYAFPNRIEWKTVNNDTWAKKRMAVSRIQCTVVASTGTYVTTDRFECGHALHSSMRAMCL